MSTKIYGGFKANINSFADLTSFRTKLIEVRKEILNEFYRAAIHEMIFRFDLHVYQAERGIHAEFSPYAEVLKMIDEANAEADKGYRSKWDYSAEMLFYPIPDKMLMVLHSEQSWIQDFVETLGGVEEYSYYDGSDGCPDREQRKIDWELAMPRLRYSDGFKFSILSLEEFERAYRGVLKNSEKHYSCVMPTQEERAQELAKSLYVGIYSSEINYMPEANDWVRIVEMLRSEGALICREKLYQRFRKKRYHRFDEDNLIETLSAVVSKGAHERDGSTIITD
ncbi:MAG: hypothetical protein EOP10_09470 [Proteobacteria bacterium]|nr:MAG: hypothetical protein EOP10_09470 [Pseudomonadota bacterium]